MGLFIYCHVIRSFCSPLLESHFKKHYVCLCLSNSPTYKPEHEKTNFGVPTRYDTNWAVQPQKQARSLKFRILEEERLYTICAAKTKTLISCAVTAQLICVFVFAYADCWFSHAGAHIFFSVCVRL